MHRSFASASFALVLAVSAHAQTPAVPSAAAPAAKPGTPDKDMQSVLDAHKALNPKPFHTLTPTEARKQPTAKDAVDAVITKAGQKPKPASVAKVEDRQIPGPTAPIDVRVYTPEGKGPFPAVVYFHGGGFVVADLDVYDASPRAISKESGAVVVSVHYRQAPEHPLPAAHEDANAAFRWVAANASELGIDAKRIAVAGESAGGNLATAVAMQNKGAIAHQLLIYPFVSTELTNPSHAQNGSGDFLIATKDLAWFWQHALAGKQGDARTVPMMASLDELKGIAPATILVASLDPLHDEGVAYGKMLRDAGVAVDVKRYDGVTHEFFGMAPVVADATKAQRDAGAALKQALANGKNVGR